MLAWAQIPASHLKRQLGHGDSVGGHGPISYAGHSGHDTHKVTQGRHSPTLTVTSLLDDQFHETMTQPLQSQLPEQSHQQV